MANDTADEPKLLTRPEVADRASRVHGLRLRPRSIEDIDIPYIVVGGRALYRTGDVDRHFEAVLAAAARRSRPNRRVLARARAA
jgi:hypothetical protein